MKKQEWFRSVLAIILVLMMCVHSPGVITLASEEEPEQEAVLSEAPAETPEVTPTEAPAKTPEVTPTEAPAKTPEVTPTEAPSKASGVTPSEVPAETPEVTPTEVPGKGSDGMSDITPSPIPEADAAPSPVLTPAGTPEVSPGVTAAATPGVTPEVSPGVTPVVSPGVTPAATPGVTPAATAVPEHQVSFRIADGQAQILVKGQDVAGQSVSTENGTLIFTVVPAEYYEIVSVLYNGAAVAQTENANEYQAKDLAEGDAVIDVTLKKSASAPAAGIRTVSNSAYTVTASYSEEAGIPEGAEMRVERISRNDSEYSSYYSQAAALEPADADPSSVKAEFSKVSFWFEDKEIKPAGTVSLQVQYNNEAKVRDRNEIKVLRIRDGVAAQISSEVTCVDNSFSGFTSTTEFAPAYGVVYVAETEEKIPAGQTLQSENGAGSVTLAADVPAGTTFKVEETAKKRRLMSKASKSAADSNVQTVTYDLSLVGPDGEKVEAGADVTLNTNIAIPSAPEIAGWTGSAALGDVKVIHVTEDGAQEELAAQAETSGNVITSVKFTTPGFSTFIVQYTVDFTYEGQGFSLTGYDSYDVSDILASFGIEGTIDAASLECVQGEADSEALRLEGTTLVSEKPFTDVYELHVTIGNSTYVITIEDDVQESSDLTQFLTNAIISGAEQNADGTYTVEENKQYTIALTFAENSTRQFDNDATLTYTMPAGITVLTQQTGDLKINIVYKGKTYQVDATYDLDTNGNLQINFDESDPDYSKLESSTNVSFRFSYEAYFDGSEDEIKFSDSVERDIVFEEEKPGEAYASKTAAYDESTGTFTYTIKVTANGGDITTVNVKDVISGDAIKFNNDVTVSGNSSSYTNNGASNGFDYTFASMKDGEEITITYTGTVDFSKDSDGDGKIAADQTKNTVTVQPEDGPPHNSEYSREISYKSTKKSNGTDAGTTADGDKILEWTVTYNELRLAKAGGDTITDTISSGSVDYMKYYGDGITVKVYDKSGTLVETRNVNYSDLTSYSDSSWTYTIPDTDTTPYMYEITYQTVVDQYKVNGGGTAVTVSNDANGSGGSAQVGPAGEIGVTKAVESKSTAEVTWVSTITVPEGGLIQAVVTDTVPSVWLTSGQAYDFYKKGSLEITGLLDGESYSVDTSDTSKVVITFYKDSGKTETGLQGTSGGHTITIRLTTTVDQDWLQAGYDTPGYLEQHTNNIAFNGKTAQATAIFGEPGIEKTGEKYSNNGDIEGIKYDIQISGVSEVPVSIEDTFDTSILEVDTSKTIYIYGGNQYWQGSGQTAVSYSETSTGILITANTVPADSDGNYYPYYRITYYLKLKDGVDLETLAQQNGGEYDVVNTAKWGDHESSYTYKTEYEYLDKQLLNEGTLGGTSRTAQYQITYNPAKATLNNGNPVTMTDTLSASLSLDYSSISITSDPEGASVSYAAKGNDAGETIVTYTIPDETSVTITYEAMVVGNGQVTITNKAAVEGKDSTATSTKDYGSASEGEGAVASFKIVKVDGYDASKKLSGVEFKIFAENEKLAFDDAGTKEIILTTDENGEILLDGSVYDFYFDECYHVQEVEAPDDYSPVGFDYLVTLTNDMATVDYGHYIYYYSDSMQIKNWPLEGLVVQKKVDSTDEKDLEKNYKFRISILNDDGSVNTAYNETNGDDTFADGVVEFELKNNETKMFWGFAKGTKYKVEEIDADGFTTTVQYSVYDEDGNVTETKTETAASHSGTLTQDDETVIFTN